MDIEDEKKFIQEEQGLLNKLHESVGHLGTILERTRLDEYIAMFHRPWKFFMLNFTAGIFRGLGIAIGMTVIFGIMLYVIAKVLVHFVDLPIIGFYVAELVQMVNQYLNQGLPLNNPPSIPVQ